MKEALSSYPVNSNERKLKWVEIRRDGDFKVNMDAYQQDLEPIPVRNQNATKGESAM